MQDSDKSMVKLKANVKAVEAIAAQVKAIAEEFQVTESVAFRIIEDALAPAAAIYDWDLSASGEAQGTGCKRQDSGECGHKCGEGACKAKEEAQAPVPVSKPVAPEAAPEATDEIWVGTVVESVPYMESLHKFLEAEAPLKATDLIETIESVWSEGNDEVQVGPIWVDSQNRVTIPLHIIELAEDINGTLNRGGALTVIKGDGKVTVLFGDKSAEREGASVVRLNCKGQAQICVSPAFTCGDAVNCSLFRDGTIAITQLSEDELLDLI